jgi:thioredoxin 1
MLLPEDGAPSAQLRSSTTMKQPIVLTAESFIEEVKKPGILVVDFWADWCGPCRAFAPVFEAAAGRHEDVRFAKVDTEAESNLAIALKIRSIPTIMVFRDGVLLLAQPGALPGEVLDEVVEKTKSIDMDDVRRRVTEAPPPSQA